MSTPRGIEDLLKAIRPLSDKMADGSKELLAAADGEVARRILGLSLATEGEICEVLNQDKINNASLIDDSGEYLPGRETQFSRLANLFLKTGPVIKGMRQGDFGTCDYLNLNRTKALEKCDLVFQSLKVAQEIYKTMMWRGIKYVSRESEEWRGFISGLETVRDSIPKNLQEFFDFLSRQDNGVDLTAISEEFAGKISELNDFFNESELDYRVHVRNGVIALGQKKSIYIVDFQEEAIFGDKLRGKKVVKKKPRENNPLSRKIQALQGSVILDVDEHISHENFSAYVERILVQQPDEKIKQIVRWLALKADEKAGFSRVDDMWTDIFGDQVDWRDRYHFVARAITFLRKNDLFVLTRDISATNIEQICVAGWNTVRRDSGILRISNFNHENPEALFCGEKYYKLSPGAPVPKSYHQNTFWQINTDHALCAGFDKLPGYVYVTNSIGRILCVEKKYLISQERVNTENGNSVDGQPVASVEKMAPVPTNPGIILNKPYQISSAPDAMRENAALVGLILYPVKKEGNNRFLVEYLQNGDVYRPNHPKIKRSIVSPKHLEPAES